MKEKKAIEAKKEKVEEIKKAVLEYPMFGIVNMENLPTFQLQKMKYKMQNVKLMMVKKRLIKRAFDGLKDKKQNLDQVLEKMKGMPALLFSHDDPFKLFKNLRASKSYAPMKAGQVAPNDIVVNAGPTDFTPGPIIGELGRVGLKTAVENGKIVIQEDSVIAKEGEVVDDTKADILAKMGIEPMEIGLNLILAYQNGEILTKDVLDIDEEEYISNIKHAVSNALYLSLGLVYPTSDNINNLLAKASTQASYIADEFGILTKDNVSKFLAKAEGEMMHLKGKLPDLEIEESKSEETKEPKDEVTEEKKEENSAEVKEENNQELVKDEVTEEKKEENSAEKPANVLTDEKTATGAKENLSAETKENTEEVFQEEKTEEEPKQKINQKSELDNRPEDVKSEGEDFKEKEKQAKDFLKNVTDQLIKNS